MTKLKNALIELQTEYGTTIIIICGDYNTNFMKITKESETLDSSGADESAPVELFSLVF